VRHHPVLLLVVCTALTSCGGRVLDEAASPAAARTAPAVWGKESTESADGGDAPGLVVPSLVPADLREVCDILGPLIPGVGVTPTPLAWFDFIGQLDQLIRVADAEAAGVLSPLTPFPVLFFERAGHGGPTPSVEARWELALATTSGRCQEAGTAVVAGS
jgi:hypothetical protein